MGWRVTATTIHCDFVNELAVLMVHGDGAAKCAWHTKHASLNYLSSGTRRHKLGRLLAVYPLALERLRLRIQPYEPYIVRPLKLLELSPWWRGALLFMLAPGLLVYMLFAFYKIQYYILAGTIDREIVRRKWRSCLGLECPKVKEFRDRALSM